MVCSSQTVRLVSHCFTTRTSRTSRTGRGLVYTPQVPLMICSSQTVRLVSHCFTTRTSRTSRTGRGLAYTPQVPLMICTSPTVRLVSHCFTTRTSRTNRTSRAKRNMPLYGSYQFVYIGQPSLFLGVIIDECLTWKPHVQNLTRKISKSLGIIYKSSFCLNKNSLCTLYYSLVYPYLYYCACVWGLTYPN